MKTKLLFLFLLPLITFAQSTATYDITFTSVWNEDDHSTLPSNAHWSDLVGAVHNNQHTFWEVDGFATLGLERVAEIGVNTDFFNEVNTQINAAVPTASTWLQKSVSPFGAIASATLTDVEFSEDFPLLTLATMIAPSPDWFSGVSNFSLLDSNGDWKTGTNDTFTIDVFTYDAGTEDGTGYSTSNPASNPVQAIKSLRNMYTFNNEKVGTISFTLKNTLSVSSVDESAEFRVTPNPSNGLVKLSNMANAVNTIKVYDVLGKEVFYSKINNTQTELNLTSLKSGIYILKISSSIAQNTVSKKLVIN